MCGEEEEVVRVRVCVCVRVCVRVRVCVFVFFVCFFVSVSVFFLSNIFVLKFSFLLYYLILLGDFCLFVLFFLFLLQNSIEFVCVCVFLCRFQAGLFFSVFVFVSRRRITVCQGARVAGCSEKIQRRRYNVFGLSVVCVL